jgi:hypothetical protein
MALEARFREKRTGTSARAAEERAHRGIRLEAIIIQKVGIGTPSGLPLNGIAAVQRERNPTYRRPILRRRDSEFCVIAIISGREVCRNTGDSCNLGEKVCLIEVGTEGNVFLDIVPPDLCGTRAIRAKMFDSTKM